VEKQSLQNYAEFIEKTLQDDVHKDKFNAIRRGVFSKQAKTALEYIEENPNAPTKEIQDRRIALEDSFNESLGLKKRPTSAKK